VLAPQAQLSFRVKTLPARKFDCRIPNWQSFLNCAPASTYRPCYLPETHALKGTRIFGVGIGLALGRRRLGVVATLAKPVPSAGAQSRAITPRVTNAVTLRLVGNAFASYRRKTLIGSARIAAQRAASLWHDLGRYSPAVSLRARRSDPYSLMVVATWPALRPRRIDLAW